MSDARPKVAVVGASLDRSKFGNKAVRAFVDGTVGDPLTADMAAATGWGYPAHLGGPFAYIDTLGADRFVVECDALAGRFGERFEVPKHLRKMAAAGARFHPI